jgi:putative membrane protein
VFIHVLILLWGAHHTYTINPLFEWIEELFGFSRNHYDRLGHFAQGFTPAILIREFLLTKGFMKKGPLFYLVTFAFILAITATYELGEFTLTFILGRNPEYVTAPQGDVWDAQWDMVYALIGAFTALLLFSKYDDEKMTLMRCSKTPHFLLFYTPIPQFVSDYKK